MALTFSPFGWNPAAAGGAFHAGNRFRVRANAAAAFGGADAGALFGFAQADDDLAKRELGFVTAHERDRIKNSAIGGVGGANYAAYLAAKRDALNAIRGEVGAHYAQMLVKYRQFGYPEEESKREALAFSKDVYKLLMTLFHSIYPKEGTKVEERF